MPPDIVPVNPASGWRVWGQERAVSSLKSAVLSSPSHAYVFAGAAQSGRKRAALEFAAALTCQDRPGPALACGDCSTCRRISRGTFPDVTVVSLATQAARDREKTKNQTLNIGTVREVSAAIAYRPTESPWRVVIVDDAETMQEPAQEAFLKTLEEPPSYTIVVLLVTDVDRLLDTIRSRCTEVRFGRSSEADVEAALRAHGVDADQAATIARHAGGSVGWALEATGNPELVQARMERAGNAMNLIRADAYGRTSGAISLADTWSQDRAKVLSTLDMLLDAWRSMLLAAYGVEGGSSTFQAADALPEPRALVRAVQSVEDCRSNLEANVRPRLALQAMVSAWPGVSH